MNELGVYGACRGRIYMNSFILIGVPRELGVLLVNGYVWLVKFSARKSNWRENQPGD